MTSPELSPEIRAMAQIETALHDLSEDAKARVLRWAGERFGLVHITQKKSQATNNPADDAVNDDDVHTSTQADKKGGAASRPDSLAEFYDQCNPQSDADKALVVAYWHQYVEESADIDAQGVNSKLKHLGHGIGNITRAFESLKALKPALLVQMRKEGTTKQARKKFKVTSEGKKAVEKMVATD